MLLYEDHAPAVVYSVAFAPDGSALASGAKDGSVSLRDAAGTPHPLLERGPQSLPVYAVAYTPDGAAVVVGGAFGWLGARNDGAGWRVFGPQSAAPVTALAMLDDRTLAVGVGDRVKPSVGKFELWDLATGRQREPSFLEPNGVRAVAACPARRTVAWATGHQKVCVWDTLKRQPVDFPLLKPCVAVALSPDGSQVAAAVDYGVKVLSVEKKRERVELKGHKGKVTAVGFSPDGETVATGSWDGTVRLWDAATGREREVFRWPVGRVQCLAYAPDGLRLAAGDDTGKVVVWDLE
ncbi:MAG: hypothetical protein C0501_11415 [Isosphaera sp.]|nr:hypothetical protein [Isosphaera sp.]